MRASRRPRTLPTWRHWTVAVALACVALLVAVIGVSVFGALQARDDGRYERGRDDLSDVRQDIRYLEATLANLTCNCTLPPDPVKDTASDRKTSNFTISTGLVTNVTGWDADTNFPFNGAASASWDPATGIYAALRNGTYSATYDGAVSLGGGSPATVAISFLLTNSTGPGVLIFPSLGAVDANNALVQTSTGFVGIGLEAGDTIQFVVLKTGAAAVLTTAFTMSIAED